MFTSDPGFAGSSASTGGILVPVHIHVSGGGPVSIQSSGRVRATDPGPAIRVLLVPISQWMPTTRKRFSAVYVSCSSLPIARSLTITSPSYYSTLVARGFPDIAPGLSRLPVCHSRVTLRSSPLMTMHRHVWCRRRRMLIRCFRRRMPKPILTHCFIKWTRHRVRGNSVLSFCLGGRLASILNIVSAEFLYISACC